MSANWTVNQFFINNSGFLECVEFVEEKQPFCKETIVQIAAMNGFCLKKFRTTKWTVLRKFVLPEFQESYNTKKAIIPRKL